MSVPLIHVNQYELKAIRHLLNCICNFQPPGLPQFQSPKLALMHGTLWPQLYSPYPDPNKGVEKP